MADTVETYDEWFQRVHAEYTHDKQRTQRYGQYLYNSLPDRWIGNVPHAYDPFYDDSKVELFLLYIENRW